MALKIGKRAIQIIDGHFIFMNLLANVLPRPKVGERTPPPQIWGLEGVLATHENLLHLKDHQWFEDWVQEGANELH